MNRSYPVSLMRKIKDIVSTITIQIEAPSIRHAKKLAETQFMGWKIKFVPEKREPDDSLES